MPSWKQVEQEAPALAAAVRRRFESARHHVMATLRKDGAPRVSGTEVRFDDGDLTIGSMPSARKGQDLLRDSRIAIHSGGAEASDTDSPGSEIDVKIAGRAILIPADGHDAFRIDVTEVVRISLGDPADHLVIETWHHSRGTQTIKRA